MQSDFISKRVKHLVLGTVEFHGYPVTGVWAITMDGFRAILLQTPYETFNPLLQLARDAYPQIPEWVDVSLNQPRHPKFAVWPMEILRMENGFMAQHPHDPKRGPDLRTWEERARDRERLVKIRGQLPLQQGEAHTVDEDAIDIALENRGECGDSDASSVATDDDCELPTGRNWRQGLPSPWPREVSSRNPLSKDMRRAYAQGKLEWRWSKSRKHVIVWLKGQEMDESPPSDDTEEYETSGVLSNE